MRLLFVGDVSLDLSLSISHVPAPDEKVHCAAAFEGLGGVVTNTAVAFAKAGGVADLLLQLGTDDASLMVRRLKQLGLTLLPVQREGGLCRVVTLLEPHGEKRLLLFPGVSLYPDLDAVRSIDLSTADHVHTAFYGPAAHELVEAARSHRLTWSIDLEPATFPGGIADLADALSGARLVFVNDRAAAAIGDDAVEILLGMGVGCVARTRGAQGAELHEGGRVLRASPPHGLPIVDTTGAGDCFAGWILRGIAGGWPLQTCLEQAVLAATLSCGRVGAQSGYPSLAEISAILNREDLL